MTSFDFSTITKQSWYPRDAIAGFLRTKEQYGGLSNVSSGRLIFLDNNVWKSSEHLYQAARFPDRPDIQEALFHAPNGVVAKQIAHANRDATRPDWQEINIAVMAWVISQRTKVEDGPFKKDLAKTGKLPIVEISYRDEFWGARPVRTRDNRDMLVGANVLGKLLTQLREGARLDLAPEGTIILGKRQHIQETLANDENKSMESQEHGPTPKTADGHAPETSSSPMSSQMALARRLQMCGR